jgi:hypothetical protein
MSHLQVDAIRRRVEHSLSPQVASFAGLTLENLQQFVAGPFLPDDAALIRLANCLGVKL